MVELSVEKSIEKLRTEQFSCWKLYVNGKIFAQFPIKQVEGQAEYDLEDAIAQFQKQLPALKETDEEVEIRARTSFFSNPTVNWLVAINRELVESDSGAKSLRRSLLNLRSAIDEVLKALG